MPAMKRFDAAVSMEVACKLGIPEAFILNKLEVFTEGGSGRDIDGTRYVYNTIQNWQSVLPCYSHKTIERAIYHLEKLGVLLSCQPDGHKSRKKYYTIDHVKMTCYLAGKECAETALSRQNVAIRSRQNDVVSSRQNDEILNSESNSESSGSHGASPTKAEPEDEPPQDSGYDPEADIPF